MEYIEIGKKQGLKNARELIKEARKAAEADGDGDHARGYRLALRVMRDLINKAIDEPK